LLAPFFAPHVEAILANAASVVGWGVGIHSPQQKQIDGDIRGEPVWEGAAALAQKFALLGLRDNIGWNYDHVSCVSCLAPLFANEHRNEIRHRVAIYSHRRMPIGLPGVPQMTNNTRFAEAIGFIASAEHIVTNSYHGAYWALLLGRRVSAIPWCVKFLHFGTPLELIGFREIGDAIKSDTKAPPDPARSFYRQCVDENIRFHRKASERVSLPKLLAAV